MRHLLRAVLLSALVVAASPRVASADTSSAYAMSKYLNDLRSAVGAPATREDARVDAAAEDHADYLSLNGIVGHYETASALGYTGYSPKDRLAAQGYAATFVSEVAASYSGWQNAMTELWAAPYHRLGMMHPHNVVAGWGHSSVNGREDTVGDFVYDFGSAAPSVVRSPAAGQTGIPTSWSGSESPNPLPAGVARPVGYPIMLVESGARTTVLRGASLTRASDGANVTLYVAPQQFESDYAVVIPQAPLAAGTTYQVRMDLTVAGQPTTEAWAFTTSADGLLHLSSMHSAWASQSSTPALAPGATVAVTITLRNTGTDTWQRGVAGHQVNLGVRDDSTWWADRGLAPGWLSANRVATMAETSVAPGATGTFAFQVKAPTLVGSYRLQLRPVIDGVAWLDDQGIYVPIVVTADYHAQWVGQSPYVTARAGDLVSLSVTYRNSGSLPWVRGAAGQEARLGIASDSTAWSPYASSWLYPTRPATTQEATVLPGQTGTFAFQMRAPSTSGVYDVRVRPVIDGVTWMEDQGVFFRIVVP